MSSEFSEIQRKILTILSDGMSHKREELWGCLKYAEDRQATLVVHISNIRRILRKKGHDIICELVHRQICYRHVRLLESVDN